MSDRRIRFTLLGTGSSGGVPRVGGDWGACDPGEPKNRRLRCSALVEVWKLDAPEDVTTVLIDTSPDMRDQLLAAQVKRLDAVVFTHDHADQTHGIDDVRALAIRHRAQVKAYMDQPTSRTLIPKFNYVFHGENGYPPIYDVQPFLTGARRARFVDCGCVALHTASVACPSRTNARMDKNAPSTAVCINQFAH